MKTVMSVIKQGYFKGGEYTGIHSRITLLSRLSGPQKAFLLIFRGQRRSCCEHAAISMIHDHDSLYYHGIEEGSHKQPPPPPKPSSPKPW